MAQKKTQKQSKKQQAQPKQSVAQQISIRRSGPAVLTPPRNPNMAGSVGRQSEIALPVRKGLSTMTIHPDNTKWLGEAAPSFQRWGMEGLTLWYEPRVSTSLNGQIALTFLSDFSDLTPNSLEETVSLAGAQRGAPWSRFQLAKQRNRLFDYCSLKDFEQGDSTTKNDRSPGRIVVWADMDASFSDQDVVGWVYIAYKPILTHPILRRLQKGSTNAGPPAAPGLPPPSESDYFYQRMPYTTAYDFLGLNPTNDPQHFHIITPRMVYGYIPSVKANVLMNIGSTSGRFYFDIILRNFSKLSTRESLRFNTYGCRFFDGNKGKYVAWDNGDVLVRAVGVVEAGGYFYLDNSIITSWSDIEMYAFELGEENGPETSEVDLPVVSTAGESSFEVFESQISLVNKSLPTGYGASFFLGPSVRSTGYVSPGGAGFTDAKVAITPDLQLCTGSQALMSRFGVAVAPNPNQVGVALVNTSSKAIYVHSCLWMSDFTNKYATTPVTQIGANYTNMDFNYVQLGTQMLVHMNVRLDVGGVVSWMLALRSSTDGSNQTASEGVGNFLINVSQPDVMWSAALPSTFKTKVEVPTSTLPF